MKKPLTLFLLLAGSFYALAQETDASDDSFYDMSLEALMEIPVSVASKTELSQRESPGIISVITDSEIRNMGARDLMDLLNMIPGIQLASDVQGNVGIGIRGNWAFEGKVLVLLDGQEINETLYSSVTFGNRFDIHSIQKIEIIRGPGSSIYGGYAELGVINIITKSGEQRKGASVQTSLGHTLDNMSRTNFSLGLGDKKEKFEYSLSAFLGSSFRSEENYVDELGVASPLTNNTLDTRSVNLGIKAGGLSVRAIYESYLTESVDWFGETINPSTPVDFTTLWTDVQYKAVVNDKLTITPRISFKNQKPWETIYDADETIPYKVTANRVSGSITANYNPVDFMQIVAGVDSYFDQAEYTGNDTEPYFTTGENSVGYNNIAGFLQARIINPVANLTLGFRYDQHNEFGGAFSPRIGLTRAFDKLHFKLLYSRAFRAPAIENINFAYLGEMSPERTGVLEFEAGYRLGKNMVLTANIFDITMDDPIVYFVDDAGEEGYRNFSKGGSRGFDLEYRIKQTWGYVTLNYSFYSADGKNQVAFYQVPQNSQAVLGFANQRLNLYSSFKLGNKFSINPSISYMGERYGINATDTNGDYVINALDPLFHLNLYLRATNVGLKGLDLGLGIYNITDQAPAYIQPYDSGHFPLYGMGREIMLRISYQLKW
ncbi:TonB-dependent receptor plug domain-containing protein [Cytophagales bacterium LB-30]|uniref:TonB-dependent receptor plug domain-containing protein n=1 Tax=Shiella aurantiaca TaxID=3058365 RepID=A0ABT8F158_9BACT|nr:TonB-dependent receptor plug domain-containing protein [Shiella aurantiaca]MDN4164039.1 TonB-dependent receptor plug domain-containing protein [Shiella aurantiaca]